jgi:hypothetical protein
VPTELKRGETMADKPTDIYNMKLHDVINPVIPGKDTQIIRVPGGWIYYEYTMDQQPTATGVWVDNYRPTSVFIPYHNEFDQPL